MYKFHRGFDDIIPAVQEHKLLCQGHQLLLVSLVDQGDRLILSLPEKRNREWSWWRLRLNQKRCHLANGVQSLILILVCFILSISFKSCSIARNTQFDPSKAHRVYYCVCFVLPPMKNVASATNGHSNAWQMLYEPRVSQNSPFHLSHPEMSACHPATRTSKTASGHFTNFVIYAKYFRWVEKLPALPFDQVHQAFPSKKNGMVWDSGESSLVLVNCL